MRSDWLGSLSRATVALMSWRHLSVLSAVAIAIVAPAHAEDNPPPQWMLGVTGGTVRRDGDATRPYGSIALTRRLKRSYVRASVTRFGAAVRQVDVTLPSTYTIGFLSAGTTFGHWFVDGYGSLGTQHYRPIKTAIGTREITGSRESGVQGAGGDAGYVIWLEPTWSLTPSISVQYIRSKALREQIGPTGPSEFETRETGATFGGTVRIDYFFGADRTSSGGLHLTRLQTTNASAALASGTRGALFPGMQSGRRADGWTELGGNATAKVRRNLYLDLSLSRTWGAEAGDLTTTALGARLLF